MTLRSDLREEPWSVDFFKALREFERSAKDKPRIGDSTVVSRRGGQSRRRIRFSNFRPRTCRSTRTSRPGFRRSIPASSASSVRRARCRSTPRSRRCTGRWGAIPSFARFTDIFGNRFQQLFFRAWANARPIAHHDRPKDDRFFRYVGTFAGIGTDSLADRDSVEDIAKLGFSGLVSSKVKSASRLKQLVRGIFKVATEVEERVGSWLVFEPSDRWMLGAEGITLGVDTYLGSRVYSINDKICVVIKARDLAEYRKFLPRGTMFDRLTDLVFFYLGHRLEFDVKLLLPARHAPAAQLGVSGELGWTAWIAPDNDAGDDVYFDDARFNALERRRVRQAEQRRSA